MHQSGIFFDSLHAEIRHRCFKLLFKSLFEPWEEINHEANNSILALISRAKGNPNGKLPKDILMECLKPNILASLQSHHSNLTSASLTGFQVSSLQ